MFISHIYHVPFIWKECFARRFSSHSLNRGIPAKTCKLANWISSNPKNRFSQEYTMSFGSSHMQQISRYLFGHNIGVLRQLVRLLYSQSDDSSEEKVFEGKNQVKTRRSNEELFVCVCKFSNMQISKSQTLLSAQRPTLSSKVLRYILLKRQAYINIYISMVTESCH